MRPEADPVEPVWIDGPGGALFAILHRSLPERAGGVCIVMLNSGMQNRTGPEGLYATVARCLAAAGLTVLRVDLAGCGDSLADNRQTHFDSHRPEEVDAVIRWVGDTLHPDVLILQGLCAGARVALKAAARNPLVDGVLAWSTTIFTAVPGMPRSPEEPADRLSQSVVSENRMRLVRFVLELKFLNPLWWKKRFGEVRTLAADAREIGRSLVKSGRAPKAAGGRASFLEAVDRYLADGRNVLFLYGDHDRMSFNEFRERFPGVGADTSGHASYALVANGGHTFSSRSTQQAVARLCQGWIGAHWPSAVPPPSAERPSVPSANPG